jgi:hypothetical protein
MEMLGQIPPLKQPDPPPLPVSVGDKHLVVNRPWNAAAGGYGVAVDGDGLGRG